MFKRHKCSTFQSWKKPNFWKEIFTWRKKSLTKGRKSYNSSGNKLTIRNNKSWPEKRRHKKNKRKTMMNLSGTTKLWTWPIKSERNSKKKTINLKKPSIKTKRKSSNSISLSSNKKPQSNNFSSALLKHTLPKYPNFRNKSNKWDKLSEATNPKSLFLTKMIK